MILYTMMPNELIYPVSEQETGAQMLIQYNGIPLLVERTNDHQFHVIRVMSSDPNHYLEDGCSPGTKISLFN
jgi:hypothetical protein